MLHLRQVGIGFCLLVGLLPQSGAFTSLLPSLRRSPPILPNGEDSSSERESSRIGMSVVGEEQKLSKKEEDILFGEREEAEAPPSPAALQRSRDRFGNILGSDLQHVPNPLDYAKDPLVNKLRTVRETVQSCPEIWSELARNCPHRSALLDEHLCEGIVDLNFAQMDEAVSKSAALFASLGVQKGTHVAVLGENSAYWLLVDQGIQRAGGVSAVRGADAPTDELRYIYEHSDSAGIVVLQGPKLLRKLADTAAGNGSGFLGLSNAKHGPVRTVILMHREKVTDSDITKMSAELGVQILVFGDLIQTTQHLPRDQYATLDRNDVATIVYTSGTTGNPKGVMLRHGNLLHQTGLRLSRNKPYEESEPLPGETMLSILPVWHITERTFELWMVTRGCRVVYSNIRYFKNDLAKHKPEWLVLVPRVLEKIASGVQDKFNGGSAAVKVLSKFFTNVGQITNRYRKVSRGLVLGPEAPGPLEKFAAKISATGMGCINAVGNKLVWSKVQQGFGGNVKTIICGGSALAGSLEKFYETAGIQICVGYGLTECAPLLAYRRSDDNLVEAGCVGLPCYDTQVRVVDPDLLQVAQATPPSLPPGEVGTVIARGPQVMLGYYKDDKATAQAIDAGGWFNTGDLGRINPVTGDLVLTGRAKDTIVLSNGENIEPTPIEDAILSGCSPLIDQVMVTGQDGRRLVAIAILNPNALAEEGYWHGGSATSSGGVTVKELQAAVDKVNDPKVTPEEVQEELTLLRSVSAQLRQDDQSNFQHHQKQHPKTKTATGLETRILADMAKATVDFRTWEQVNSVYVTLEPFAMANGLLTQSYKVKRNVVADRYQNVLPK